MAINRELSEYLSGLYGRDINPPMQDEAEMPPAPPAFDPDLPLVSLSTGEDIPFDATPEQAAAIQAAGFAAIARRRPVAMNSAPAAEVAPPPAESPSSYLEALSAAQERDRMTAGFAGGLAGVEQAAQIASRGLYRPMGMPRAPSAVAEVEQRQKAVEGYLERQRDLRAETRAERASEAQIELARGQAAREQARAKAEELRLAIEANQAPERVQKLRAETLAALERAKLYATQAEAAAKGKQPRLVVGGAPSKPAKEEKTPALRQLPATVIEDIAGIDVAVSELKDLTEAYKQADLGGVLGRVGSQFGALAPESAKLYEARAAPVRQAVGIILEGGKLAEGDISRYLQMMPRPGDSADVADAKFQSLQKVMLAIKQAKTKAFRETGFQVGEQAPATADAPQRLPLASAAEAAVQAVEAAKRAGKPKSEIDALTKQAQAAIEAASKGD
jgi:hypothetical protein